MLSPVKCLRLACILGLTVRLGDVLKLGVNLTINVRFHQGMQALEVLLADHQQQNWQQKHAQSKPIEASGG